MNIWAVESIYGTGRFIQRTSVPSSLKYFARLNERLYNELGHFAKIRMLVIYTADVDAGSTNDVLDIGGLRMEIEEAFLVGIDSGKIWDDLCYKIYHHGELADEDLMRLIIYPLTFKGVDGKQDAVTRVIELTKRIEDGKKMAFVLKMVWAFSDKFITRDDADKIKEELRMTKVEMLYEEEKREAVNKAVEATTKEVTKRVTTEVTATVTATVTDEVSTKIATNLLQNGYAVEDVAKNTGLTKKKVSELKKKLPVIQ